MGEKKKTEKKKRKTGWRQVMINSEGRAAERAGKGKVKVNEMLALKRAVMTRTSLWEMLNSESVFLKQYVIILMGT